MDQLNHYPDRRYHNLLPLIELINKKLLGESPFIIAVDGRSASGKSTAADLLSKLWNTSVIHMDDFFLPLTLRTAERLEEPGGNVHYERFIQEVVSGLKKGSRFSYRKFDCSTMDYSETIHVEPGQVIIVEGAYSLHPNFEKYYDISVFFDIDHEEQLKRIRKRNGDAKAEVFRTRWIPMENRYFDKFSIADKCDLLIVNKELDET